MRGRAVVFITIIHYQSSYHVTIVLIIINVIIPLNRGNRILKLYGFVYTIRPIIIGVVVVNLGAYLAQF